MLATAYMKTHYRKMHVERFSIMIILKVMILRSVGC